MTDGRRKPKRERREHSILVRVTRREKAELARRADAASRPLSDFLVIQALGRRMA